MKRRKNIGIDLTPLIDVAFILLIFFLISSTFKKDERTMMLNLPESEQAPIQSNEKDLTIELGVSEIAYQGKKVNFKTLSLSLAKIPNPKKVVLIYIDRSVNYQRITRLFDVLKAHNLNNLSLQSRAK